jgi:multiple sugar transport system substrate-binding protein
MTKTTLRGMTWDHPRGYEPLVACSAEWLARTGVAIEWDRRSLQDFESFPVEELARHYDLIVIDHPHIGQVTRDGCLVPLDRPGAEAALEDARRGSVGASYESYCRDGRVWALPIDAATQVQAWAPARLDAPPRDWDAVMALARAGRVLCPMRPPHSLMTFYTLCAHLGAPPAARDDALIDAQTGAHAWALLQDLVAAIDPACFDMDPIATFEAMASPDAPSACAPLIYGYVSYAINGFRPTRIAFTDMPVVDERAPRGSALGGTGIAVSALRDHIDAALDFALWVAGGEAQRTIYAPGGGQPGHAAAWEDAAVNAATGDFYRGTRATLDGAWVRPRHPGYMAFQQAASDRINAALRARAGAAQTIDALNARYRESLRPVP